jgi:hypothetical protein
MLTKVPPPFFFFSGTSIYTVKDRAAVNRTKGVKELLVYTSIGMSALGITLRTNQSRFSRLFQEKGRGQLKLQVQRLPKDTAAAMTNSPGNHAHEPDAAAAVDQIDAPPHLREGKSTRRSTTKRTQRSNRGKKKTTVAWQAGHSSVVSSLLPCSSYSPARRRARGQRRRTPSGGRRYCRRRRRSYGTCSQARPPLHHPCRRSNTSFLGEVRSRSRSLVVSCLVGRALSAASLSLSLASLLIPVGQTPPQNHTSSAAVIVAVTVPAGPSGKPRNSQLSPSPSRRIFALSLPNASR